ncbi:uncharacterized protein ASPGLDRAFT_56383 [Aspergillus glaucus CBS 516.65]|uniref:Uncharacterized protein n=1 Tax=Aspergillus glaucus CBS 516.65 TaxID=1160497 RepID=A0A1L9VSF5_ASPGL|nr:hypothetical protein ASPGLDRAFT_56383 [Aspergillus glaucus CBS 516.65]OJJ86837.1 hypothetical protein ASPGLDRAFT_56383 [Aspergillus glaucus CBS 516.65]
MESSEGVSVASSYEFASPIKRFDKGTRDIFRVELVNGESYVFKPHRPKDDENDRFEYIPEGELKVYNKFRHLQGKYIPICYGIVEMNSMSGLLYLLDADVPINMLLPERVLPFVLCLQLNMVIQRANDDISVP